MSPTHLIIIFYQKNLRRKIQSLRRFVRKNVNKIETNVLIVQQDHIYVNNVKHLLIKAYALRNITYCISDLLEYVSFEISETLNMISALSLKITQEPVGNTIFSSIHKLC